MTEKKSDETHPPADTPNKDALVKPARGIPRAGFIAVGAVFFATAVGAALFGQFNKAVEQKSKEEGACEDAAAKIEKLKPFAKGSMANWKFAQPPFSLKKLTFLGPDNQKIGMDAFSGRFILLNLWASWCEPCREEMPSLNKLQTMRGSSAFSVIALNTETFRPERGKAFLSRLGANALPYYSDPAGEAVAALKQKNNSFLGLPISILINGDGCQIASFSGPADWASDEAARFIQAGD